MARTFTQKHYLAFADVLVASELAALAAGGASTGHARYGIAIVRAQLVEAFRRDLGNKFDSDKFNRYIAARIGR